MQFPKGIQNIVVTGASSGIGREVSLAFSSMAGFRVFAVARRLELLDSLVLESESRNVIPVQMDLSSGDVGPLLQALKREGVSHISVLVGNAGMLLNKSFEEIELDEWDAIYRTNVIGPAILVRDLMPFLGQEGVSHVVHISSMGGITGTAKFPGLTAYSSSKGAFSVLTEVLAEEYKESSVVFNGLALGSVATEMLEKAFPGYQAKVSASEMAGFIVRFGLDGWRFFKGKVLPVSNSTP
jgi:NAD(P)-dependent dehydrogenase (short-subunit alcohol dehydrogenase family)